MNSLRVCFPSRTIVTSQYLWKIHSLFSYTCSHCCGIIILCGTKHCLTVLVMLPRLPGLLLCLFISLSLTLSLLFCAVCSLCSVPDPICLLLFHLPGLLLCLIAAYLVPSFSFIVALNLAIDLSFTALSFCSCDHVNMLSWISAQRARSSIFFVFNYTIRLISTNKNYTHEIQ